MIDTTQAAKLLNVNVEVVRRMIAEGSIRAVNVGRKGGRPTYRIPRAEIERLTRSSRV
jgi:excisionase family DNA binding protein